MAFGWFRRRQKLILIVMAFLMVSFLIGFQGFDAFIQKDPGKEEIGKTRHGKLVRNDLMAAKVEMDLLGEMAGILYRSDPLQIEELRAVAEQKEASNAFALLLVEARQSGVKVTDQDVADFFTSAGLKDDQYNAQIKQLMTRGATE
ncbi:MAG: hypothetical protein HZA50_02570, partial [Planctomycetes bacterium]|nr:hypothetical protein [Planctomycetota bacterium]